MIAELPDVGCTAGSPFGRQIETAKRTFIRLMQRRVQHLRLTGGIFFERLHGQIGVAPNGVELHPVLTKVEAIRWFADPALDLRKSNRKLA